MSFSFIDAHYIQGSPKDHLDGVIAVSQNVGEARSLALLNDDSILGVVGAAEFNKSSLKSILKSVIGFSKIHVFRHQHPEIDSVWENGMQLVKKAGYSCEVEIKDDQYFDFQQITEKNPEMNYILASEGLSNKDLSIKDLSKQDNVALKILGSTLEYEASRKFILEAIDLFGPEKVMFGMGSKEQFLSFSKMIDDFSPSDKENLFCNSARKWYKLMA